MIFGKATVIYSFTKTDKEKDRKIRGTVRGKEREKREKAREEADKQNKRRDFTFLCASFALFIYARIILAITTI